MIRLPKHLQPGDTIGVVAPASAAGRSATAKGIAYLEHRGYKVKTSTYLTRGKHYLAGPDDIRVSNLQEFLLDPAIAAVFCVRGGYGLLRIIDKLDYARLAQAEPKILLGYSDITAVQMALLAKCGWISYSGPMVASEMGKDISEFSEKWLWPLMEGDPFPLQLRNPDGQPLEVYRHGKADGRLIGGCFSLMTPLLSTEYMPSLDDNILVIEDVGEATYKIDKFLQTLKLHGVFDRISGLVIGQLTDSFPQNSKATFSLKELLDDTIAHYDFPVITNFAYGHVKQRFTLPVGIQMKMNTSPLEITFTGR